MLKNLLRRSTTLFNKSLYYYPTKYHSITIEKSYLKVYKTTASIDEDHNFIAKGPNSGQIEIKNHFETSLASLVKCLFETLKFVSLSESVAIQGFEIQKVYRIDQYERLIRR